jgi:hypothetical protein
MDSDVRAQRHEQLWQAGNNSARRIALGGLLFALIILIKVVAPYQEKAVLEKTLAAQTASAKSLKLRLNKISAVEDELDEIERVIINAPWDSAKDELIRFYANGGGNQKEKANETIKQIADLIHAAIVEPLTVIVKGDGVSDDLASLPKMVADAIEEWERGKLNTKWYYRVASKEQAMDEVKDILLELRSQSKQIVQGAKLKIGEQTKPLENKLVEVRRKEKKISVSIQAALDDALPSWAGKLILAKTIVLFYPWILVGLAVYLVGSAVNASRHFHGMADEKGWTAEERSDPLMSSMWTLTFRGAMGTAITLGVYSWVLLCLWYCFYLSQQYAQVEFITRLLNPGESQIGQKLNNIPIGLGHGLMALVVVTCLVMPWRKNASIGAK